MNHDISLKDLLMVPDGPPEAVWQSALQSAFDSVPRPEDEDPQSRIEPENVVTTEGTAAVESDPGAEDDLMSTDENVVANEISDFDAGPAGSADSVSGSDEVSRLSGDAGEGYDN